MSVSEPTNKSLSTITALELYIKNPSEALWRQIVCRLVMDMEEKSSEGAAIVYESLKDMLAGIMSSHDCGECNGLLLFDGMDGEYKTYVCANEKCQWWHTSKDCCHG